MGHCKTRAFSGGGRVSCSLVGLWVVALALAEGQMAVPSSGQLCISDCSTCPVICTAPPPPILDLSPPEFYMSPKLTWPPPPPAPPTPASYFMWGTPPPPVRNYLLGAQPSGQMPQTAGPRDYSYPYYYFYSSNSSSPSSLSTFVVFFTCLFHFVYSG